MSPADFSPARPLGAPGKAGRSRVRPCLQDPPSNRGGVQRVEDRLITRGLNHRPAEKSRARSTWREESPVLLRCDSSVYEVLLIGARS